MEQVQEEVEGLTTEKALVEWLQAYRLEQTRRVAEAERYYQLPWIRRITRRKPTLTPALDVYTAELAKVRLTALQNEWDALRKR